jgi:hypothetical protein
MDEIREAIEILKTKRYKMTIGSYPKDLQEIINKENGAITTLINLAQFVLSAGEELPEKKIGGVSINGKEALKDYNQGFNHFRSLCLPIVAKLKLENKEYYQEAVKQATLVAELKYTLAEKDKKINEMGCQIDALVIGNEELKSALSQMKERASVEKTNWGDEVCGHCMFFEDYHCRRFPNWQKVGANSNACAEFKAIAEMINGEGE